MTPSAHKHVPGDITQNSTNRFVTDTEKSKWNTSSVNADKAYGWGDHSTVGYLTKHQSLDVKADKATSLAGYGIEDAYTKSETDTALSKKANSSTTLAGYGIKNAYTITEVDTSLKGKANTTHTHAIKDVTGLQAGLDGKASTSALATTKSDLETLIDGKADTAHNHDTVYAPKTHTHTQYLESSALTPYVKKTEVTADITASEKKLQTALDTGLAKKSDTGHTHTSANITDLQGKLNTKQDKLTAGTNITISGSTISATVPSNQATKAYVDGEIKTKVTDKLGAKSGIATLDTTGKVPANQLPSYVDDVIEGKLVGADFFPVKVDYSSGSNSTTTVEYETVKLTPESGKIYIDIPTGKIYRWSGTSFSVISETLALGETSTTAYAGSKGKANATAISSLQSGKQDKIVSGTHIKTVGGQSIVGSGNVALTSLGSLNWSQLVSVPATASRWPKWSEVTDIPSFSLSTHNHDDKYQPIGDYSLSTHSHAWGEVTGKPTTATRWPAWSEVTSKPSTFTPASHKHTIADVTSLTEELAGKQVAGDYATSTELKTGLDGKANTSHTHDYLASGGNAVSASKWNTARTITLTGAVTGSVSIDGSANVSMATANNHSHAWRCYNRKTFYFCT